MFSLIWMLTTSLKVVLFIGKTIHAWWNNNNYSFKYLGMHWRAFLIPTV